MKPDLNQCLLDVFFLAILNAFHNIFPFFSSFLIFAHGGTHKYENNSSVCIFHAMDIPQIHQAIHTAYSESWNTKQRTKSAILPTKNCPFHPFYKKYRLTTNHQALLAHLYQDSWIIPDISVVKKIYRTEISNKKK